MFGLVLLIPSIQYLTFIDELCAYSFLALALFDCTINRNWAKYKLLWILMSILTFYGIYSFILGSNTTSAIALDWIIELKPFIPFAVLLAISPKLTNKDKRLITYISLANASVCALALLGGMELVSKIVFHIMLAGSIIFLSCMLILYCNTNNNGNISRSILVIVTMFLTLGLLCGRSKYYGIYILSIFFLFIYRPGIMRNLNVKHFTIIALIPIFILIAAWSKIQYYFLSGESSTFDPSVIESFARPVLYLTGVQILFDYFPFGSGMASFATYASSWNYSNTYYEYGIHTVHGLSPNGEFNFICDAFYPSLAQFGFAGIFLFIYFWIYVYKPLKSMMRTNADKYKIPFSIGSLIICFLLIECIAGTTLTQTTGLIAMATLGILCAQGYTSTELQSNEITFQLQKIK